MKKKNKSFEVIRKIINKIKENVRMNQNNASNDKSEVSNNSLLLTFEVDNVQSRNESKILNNLIKNNQVGKLRIFENLLMKEDLLEIVNLLMKNLFIIRCEFNYGNKSFEYIAYSILFKELEEGMEIPLYGITVQKISNDKGKTKYALLAETIKTETIVRKVQNMINIGLN